MTELPKKPFSNIAISMSGGGYRASSFHFGTLTYLSRQKWKDESLLDRVRILSTVSGGTFTGVCYSSMITEGKSFNEFYKKLYDFLQNVDLLGDGLAKLMDYKNWKSSKGRSLINAFSKVYFEKLEQNKFNILYTNKTHLKEIIFNATELSYGLPFRFQKTELNEEEYAYAYIGNRQVNIPREALYEIRLSDVIAASSCFPLGFEPINFPDDFKHKHSKILNDLKESYLEDMWGNQQQFPIGLMDGGIVDNQGIDSVHWAELRMREYKGELKEYKSDDKKAVDLYIVSDVSSPYMDSFVKTEEKVPFKGFWKWSFKGFGKLGIGFIAGLVAITTLLLLKLHMLLVFFIGL